MFSSRGAAASSARWRAIVGRSLRTAGPVCTSAGEAASSALAAVSARSGLQNVEGQARAADDAFADGVHVVDEVAGENRREVHLGAAGRVGPHHRVRKTAGEGFECGTQGGVIGFEEEGDLRKIHAAPFGEGLQRIEDGAACMGGKRIERHAPRSMGDDGSCRQGQRRGYLPDGLVAHRDQVYVRVGQPCRVCRPLRSGECGDSLPRAALRANNCTSCRPLRATACANASARFPLPTITTRSKGLSISFYSKSTSRTLSCDLRAVSLSVSSSWSMRVSSSLWVRSTVVCPDFSTASSMP